MWNCFLSGVGTKEGRHSESLRLSDDEIYILLTQAQRIVLADLLPALAGVVTIFDRKIPQIQPGIAELMCDQRLVKSPSKTSQALADTFRNAATSVSHSETTLPLCRPPELE